MADPDVVNSSRKMKSETAVCPSEVCSAFWASVEIAPLRLAQLTTKSSR